MSGNRIRVQLADGDFLLGLGIQRALENLDYLTLESIVRTGEDAVASAVASGPHIVLMETVLPDMDGFTATREIIARAAGTKVVMLASAADRDTMVRAYQAGASSYLTKNEITEDLGPALRMIHRGALVLSMAPDSPRLQSPRPAIHPRKASLEAELSLREKQLLTGVAAGHTNAELGRQLHLSEALVKATLSTMMTRLEVANRVQLAVLGVRSGLVA